MLEEREIKIEYNDPNETDPLKQDMLQALENSVESYRVQGTGNCIDNSGSNLFQDPEQQSYILNTKYKDNTTKKCNLNSCNLGKLESQIITWYDTIDSNGRLLCKFCDLRYSTTQTLRHHVTTKHPNKATDLRNKIIKNKRNCKHLCHVCKERLKSLMDLKEHVNNNHSMEALSLSCLFCDATFNDSEELTNHMHLIHNKVCNVYTCDICGYRTIKKSHFIKHTKIHGPEKSISCDYCDYATNNLQNLKVHKHIHTNTKPYSCSYKGCDYRSAARSGLRSHQLKHFLKLNLLFCDKCSYSTVYRQSLRKHIEGHKRKCMSNIL